MPPIKPTPQLKFEVLGPEGKEPEFDRLKRAHEAVMDKARAVSSFIGEAVLQNPEQTDERQMVGYSLREDERKDLILRTHLTPTGKRREERSERVAIFGPDPGYKEPGFRSGLDTEGVLPTTYESDRHEKVHDGLHPDSEQFRDVVDTLNLMARQAITEGWATEEEVMATEAFSQEDLSPNEPVAA